MSAVIDVLTDNPELVLIVAFLARVVLAYQRELSWPEYRYLHRIRRVVFPLLDRFTTARFGRSLLKDKGGRDDAEFLATLDRSVPEIVRALRSAGGSLHLLSTLKRRPDEHGDPLSIAHVVFTHDDGHQTEAYVFRNADGTVDVYAHFEAGVTDPLGHLTDAQTDGDPQGVVRMALGLEIDDNTDD